MGFGPARAREKKDYVSCHLDFVVSLERDNSSQFLIWQRGVMCCGSKGAFPSWAQERSVCLGPSQCVLLQAGELFYPPDKTVWLPYVDTKDWESLKTKFVSLKECRCVMPTAVIEHIKEQQRKWGVGECIK